MTNHLKPATLAQHCRFLLGWHWTTGALLSGICSVWPYPPSVSNLLAVSSMLDVTTFEKGFFSSPSLPLCSVFCVFFFLFSGHLGKTKVGFMAFSWVMFLWTEEKSETNTFWMVAMIGWTGSSPFLLFSIKRGGKERKTYSFLCRVPN